MEERKLNLNARFLSVRRIATTPVCTDGEKEKIIQRPDGRHTLPHYKSDFCLEQVTEPVAVPFNWEHIPGKAKEDKEPEPQPREETSVTPRLPPGKPIDYVTKRTSERDHADRNGIRPQFKSYSLNENVMDLKCSKEKKMREGRKWRMRMMFFRMRLRRFPLQSLSPSTVVQVV
ncbi:uncharacterized protein Pyn_14143 [Prunus yedoensis var. nudiflora]|uniref:Uncharacterized protein n=1 Tax=Prunus yedoensis var. nudiflora TaxID=2094558 RepID=A0A314Y3J0_PRUYE|nr:uncharacterized protein Pyn_14143 [Prunus yedoensis var. nudiflora]